MPSETMITLSSVATRQTYATLYAAERLCGRRPKNCSLHLHHATRSSTQRSGLQAVAGHVVSVARN
jgi:hypothetical protein